MDGVTWQKAKIPPYKHATAPYGAAMAGLPSQITYGSWQKVRHDSYLTTLLRTIISPQLLHLWNINDITFVLMNIPNNMDQQRQEVIGCT